MGLFDTLKSAAGFLVSSNPIIGPIVGLLSGSTPSVQAAVTPRQAALLSGGTAGPVLATGTSVGPLAVQVAGQIAQVAVPALIGRLAGNVPVPQFLVDEAAAGRAAGPRTVTRKQLILMQARAANPGATAKKIIRSARECGIELAAATFGLNVLDVCFLIAQPPTRRSRGISAADMRRTRSTIRKVLTISHDLKALKPAARRAHARH